ncbi:MAG: DHA2 family efflux MFS transporter permease subunit [Thauera sp.]|jgi:DHA2 family multidrug resistance protein|nr:DHA2 family efflux MFS transporter permease subunit [Thauera sp.]
MSVRPLQGAPLVLLTLGLSLGTFMQVLDSSIANVSLPAIAGDLAVSPSQGTWVITSFAVSNAIFLPLTGWLTRRFGDVRLFILSTLLFTLASWLCGLANSLPLLIAARVFQGAVAGPMVPLSQSLLLNSYPPEQKGLALALWSMTVVVAPVLGPILGGWITDNISWPWIFYINLPFGLLSAFITWTLIGKRSSQPIHSPIDTVGLVLLVLGIGALQVLLDRGNELDWFESGEILAYGLVSVVCLALLIVWELTDRHPVVELRLFAQRNFLVGTLILSVGYMVFFGNVVILPLWLQTSMGYTATWAGLAAAPVGLVPLILSAVVGKNLHRIDLRIWASFSFAIFAAVSFWNSQFTSHVSFEQIVLPRIVMGFGVATFFVPLTALTLAGIPARQLPSATGLSNFCRLLAGSFGTSLSITLWQRRDSYHHSVLVEHVSSLDPHALEALAPLAAPELETAAILNQIISKESLLMATNDISWLSGCFFAALIVLVWLAKPPQGGINAAAGGGEH